MPGILCKKDSIDTSNSSKKIKSIKRQTSAVKIEKLFLFFFQIGAAKLSSTLQQKWNGLILQHEMGMSAIKAD